jgi:hypothetical protein
MMLARRRSAPASDLIALVIDGGPDNIICIVADAVTPDDRPSEHVPARGKE